ncbi:MAG: hypothetical protein HC888_03565 [Candidatus Competibacteraceae bacterium]|nr:hypothetical protein [Candidatus Competibacteraceae bacterium]
MLAVKNESIADALASGSSYACHPLGGISRSVKLFALPVVNLASLAVQTTFDETFSDAHLKVLIDVANESDLAAENLELHFALKEWGTGTPVPLKETSHKLAPTAAGKMGASAISLPVSKPKKWDCENPNLYVLTCTLKMGGQVLQSVEQRLGFRQIDVRGNQVLINGLPVKLRGTNRHEVHPRMGRVVPEGQHLKDVEMFLEGNVNHIRTCHYPPDQALMEAADELGMLIECEGPLCWTHRTKPSETRPRELMDEAIVRQNLEMVVQFRNHPSVILWSIANESHWDPIWETSAKTMSDLDPTRPSTFNYLERHNKDNTRDQNVCAVLSKHYPGLAAAEYFKDYQRPVNFGEFTHLNSYNRHELATDVGLRDLWGERSPRHVGDHVCLQGCARWLHLGGDR